ncbi:hypothetical protein, partial [Aeromonas rivipollensis]
MSDLHKLKARSARLKQLKEISHLREVPLNVESNRHLVGGIDEDTLKFADMSREYSQRISNFNASASKEEASFLINSIDDGNDP